MSGVMLPLAVPEKPARPKSSVKTHLKESDAIDIWIARWLRVRRKDLVARYECDPRRLYEVWWGEKFPGSRQKAVKLFAERYPGLMDRVDFGTQRRVPRAIPADLQPSLFDGS